MTINRVFARLLVLAGLSYSATAFAQQGPLVDFVNNPDNNATVLQQAVGNAVMAICPNLGGFGQPDGPQRDLFLRCNELVATAADLNDPGSPPGGRSLGYTDPDELLSALQQVWGEELHANSDLTARLTNGQFANIAGRLNALRLGAANAGIGGRLVAGNGFESNDDLVTGGELSHDGRRPRGGAAAGDTDVAGSRWGWFVEGSFNTGDRDQTANVNAFDFDASSFTIGLDYLFDQGVIGASFGIDQFDAEFDNAELVTGGDTELEGTSGSVFAAYFGDRFYFDALASFGSLDADSTRRLVYDSSNQCAPPDVCPPQSRSLIGETDGDFFNVGATVGYTFNLNNWDIDTTLALSYRDINVDGFDEADEAAGGGMALRYSDQTIESLRSIVGVAFTGFFSQSWGVLSPQFRAEWHHEFEDDPVLLSAKYVIEDNLGTVPAGDFTGAACLSCATFATDDIEEDFGLLSAGLSAVFAQRIQLYFVYDALVGVSALTSNAFSVGLRGQF